MITIIRNYESFLVSSLTIHLINFANNFSDKTFKQLQVLQSS